MDILKLIDFLSHMIKIKNMEEIKNVVLDPCHAIDEVLDSLMKICDKNMNMSNSLFIHSRNLVYSLRHIVRGEECNPGFPGITGYSYIKDSATELRKLLKE